MPDRPVEVRRLPADPGARPRCVAAGRPDGPAAQPGRLLPGRARHVLVRRRASASTRFALVDGVAVIALQFGDGFELTLLGLARMALPRPQAAIVSIELALVVRISSKEGVIWVQAQLTDNSWLLYSDVRLTGGFAYVVWFGGPTARRVRAHDGRLPPGLPPRRLPGRAAARPAVEHRQRHRDQGRRLLRADVGGRDGRRRGRGVGELRLGLGPAVVRGARHRLLRPVPLQGDRLRADRRRHHDRHLVRRHHLLDLVRRRAHRRGPGVPRPGQDRRRAVHGVGAVRRRRRPVDAAADRRRVRAQVPRGGRGRRGQRPLLDRQRRRGAAAHVRRPGAPSRPTAEQHGRTSSPPSS